MPPRLVGVLTGLAAVSAALGSETLADHFSNQVQRGLHAHAATHLPASAAGPILKFDPKLFVVPSGKDDPAAGDDHERLAYEALLAHEVAAHRASPETAFPYALCGPQESSEEARTAIATATLSLAAHAKAQPPKVAFASRVLGVACWQANLRAADAYRLAASPAFFHVSPVPAAAKIAPRRRCGPRRRQRPAARHARLLEWQLQRRPPRPPPPEIRSCGPRPEEAQGRGADAGRARAPVGGPRLRPTRER